MILDHLAVSGETREAAQAYVEEALGVAMQPGGEHAVFHTHNALLGLDDGLYLEAIAINPDAPPPTRPRWFDLDRFAGAPRLTNWICATSDLTVVLERLGSRFGEPVALKRDDLQWRMAVPDSGQLPFDACAPALIQWDAGVHPAEKLSPSGVRLRRLTVSHPKAIDLAHMLTVLKQDDRLSIEVGEVGLIADFETPHGNRMLTA